ncbi:MAG: hypothetical protein P1U56_16750 [Saprospiraceae bacterium]|nr:hypothetical protein [Saprospiraceae bacterium]
MSSRKGYFIKDQFAPHYLTFTTVGWIDIFTRIECRDIVMDSLRYCSANKGLILHAYVIMSNHLHLVLSADNGTDGLSSIIRDMKKFITKKLIQWIIHSRKESRKEWMKVVLNYHAKFNSNNSKYQLWQQHNRPMILLHPKFTRQKIAYIHYNPVKAGIVDYPEDYRYSSARNYAERDDYLIEVKIIDLGFEEGYVFI